jgi:hypothetical protein
VAVGAGMLTGLILQYPYSGSTVVKSDPFTARWLTSVP